MSMNTLIDTKAFAVQLNSDGNISVDGEHVDGREIYWESSVGDEVDILGFGVWRVVDTVVGKTGNYKDGYWDNYIVLQQGNTFLKLPGSYDSWDAQGWDGTVEQVKNEPKVVFEWVKA